MQSGYYFDLNGCIGRGAYEKPEFETAADLLRHMDYLEIDRSLVWHVQSRDMNPVTGNKRLLQEIRDCGEAVDRLIPAFTVSATDLYEHGTLDYLKACFRENTVKALRIFPRTSRFHMGELTPLLEELHAFQPVVFWNFKDSKGRTDERELAEMATDLPGISFVLTELMWGQFSEAVDLMRRAPNVYIDTSWLHMRDTIPFLCEQFGTERVLFGTGFKSHYGAAIAALNHAPINEDQKNKIASRNVENLLGIDPLSHKLCKAPVNCLEKPLWETFRAGYPVTDTEIYDVHCHAAPHTRGWILPDVDIDENLANLERQMDANGVRKMFICPEQALFGDPLEGNRFIEQKLHHRSDRFGAYLIYNPLYGDELQPELDDFFSRDFFVGFKALPSYWKRPVTDSGFDPMYAYADKHGLPILFHTWDDKYNSPAMFTDIVPEHPNAYFLLGHSGGGTPGRREAETLASANKNVYLEFCGSFTTPMPFEDSAEKVGWDHVVFGSDTSAHDLSWELGRFLSLPVPDKTLKPALAANYKSILDRRRKT